MIVFNLQFFGGRGASSSGGSGGSSSGELILPNGSKIEFEGELKFGKKDPTLTKEARKTIEDWEEKRVKNKLEYAYSVMEDGTPVGAEVRGSKGSVRSPLSYSQEGATLTHIHPREEGLLGGTFSEADLYAFAKNPSKTTRARAKEGAYSISKNDNFDAQGFKGFVHGANKQFVSIYRTKVRELSNNYKSGKISYNDYAKGNAKAFNTALIELHNIYSSGQKTYGYSYTLEKPKN